MTPAQHKTKAQDLLTAFETPSPDRVVYTDQNWLEIVTRAHLGRTAGTGAHYTAADALLAETDAQRVHPDQHFLRALTHALLADL